MTRKRAYRGKHPTRICQVEGLRKTGTYLVTTNDRNRFRIHAHENMLRDMPDLGEDIAQFTAHKVTLQGHPADCICPACLGLPVAPHPFTPGSLVVPVLGVPLCKICANTEAHACHPEYAQIRLDAMHDLGPHPFRSQEGARHKCTCGLFKGDALHNPSRHCGTAPTADSCDACQTQDAIAANRDPLPAGPLEPDQADLDVTELVCDVVEPEGEVGTHYALVLDALWQKLNVWGSHTAAHGKLNTSHGKLMQALAGAHTIALELDKLSKEAI